jgi:hypothetical protein
MLVIDCHNVDFARLLDPSRNGSGLCGGKTAGATIRESSRGGEPNRCASSYQKSLFLLAWPLHH